MAQNGMNFGYTDGIGNRTQTVTNGRTPTYTPNKLNQYTSLQAPPAADVVGEAEAGAALTVQGQAASRQGRLFHRAVPVDNSTQAKHEELVTQAILNGVVAEERGRAFEPHEGSSGGR